MITADNSLFQKIRIRRFFIWLLLGALLYVFIFILIGAFTSLDPEDPSISDDLLWTLGYGLVILWVVRELRKHGGSFKQILGDKPHRKQLPYILSVVPLIIFALGAVMTTFYLFSFPFPGFIEEQLNEKLSLNISSFFFAVIAAPVIEETFFRGILLNRWAVKWNISKGLVISSLAFSIFHLDIIGSFVFGLILGTIYLKTKNLWIPIIIHFLNNAFVFSFAIIESLINSTSAAQDNTLDQLRSDAYLGPVLLLISLPWVIYFLRRNWPKNSETPAFC